MSAEQDIRDEIDNYSDSLFAIIGFMNFYRFDDATRKMRDDVKLFQGRRLTPPKSKPGEKPNPDYVTPDLGVLLPTDVGVLGEVKKSFPRDSQLWMDDFEQLMAYDDDLTGWPNASQKATKHDIVLLLHQSRAVAVKDYFEQNNNASIKFTRPFSMVEFNRSSQGQEYFFFRTIFGAVTEKQLADRLKLGVSVPMNMYLLQYSTVKLYDTAPPVAYLLELIWTQVIAVKVTNTPGYKIPSKKQKVKVEVSLAEISETLETNFSFQVVQQRQGDSRQPKVLQDSWVKDACEALIKFGDAQWADATKTKLTVNFTKRDDVLEHFVKQCALNADDPNQMQLFKDKGVPKK